MDINTNTGGRVRTGQGQPHAKLAAETREEERAADVREEADPRLGHGKERLLRRHAVAPGHGEADAAAHDDAVDQRHIRLLQRRQRVVRLPKRR